MELSLRWLLRAALSVAMATTLLVCGAANAERLSVVFKLYKDACLPLSTASSRFLGLPNRLSCITECIKAQKDFNAVQVLPALEQPGRLDCECVLLSAGTPFNRLNCERWDLQTHRGGNESESGGGSDTGPNDYSSWWSATFCPMVADPWNPVIDINKCIFMKNSHRLEVANLTGNPCINDYELFNVKDSTTQAQLQKYVSYLANKSAEAPPYWVRDRRSGMGPLCTVVFANGTVGSPEGCNATPGSAESPKLYPICERTLAFAGADTSNLMVINAGGNSLFWYYFSSLEVGKNDSCNGSLPALIESDDMFMHVKNGILSRGWSNKNVWIAKSGYVNSRTTVSSTSECIALYVNATTDTVNSSVVALDCSTPSYYVCEARYSQGSNTGPGQSAWLVGDTCPILVQPPTTAMQVRTVGYRCFFYTSVSYNMSSSLPPDACSQTGNPYVAAMINSDFLMSRYYVTSISVEAGWKVWMLSNGWNENFIEGYAITSLVTENGAFYLNSSGNPFKGDASISRPVLCQSSQQICNTGQNYRNFASASNSCVAVEMGSKTWNQSISTCPSKAAGSLLRLDSEAKFNQIRELLYKNGNLNQLFWVLNGTNAGECTALQIPSASEGWSSSVHVRPCTDTQNYLCETPPIG